MASTLLYPITVSAKVVRTPAKVPALLGAPFNRDATLEAGVHVHWALPDSLTAATVLTGHGSKELVFPAVPDLWLVVRFNAGASSSTPFARRTWNAWVVDSIHQSVTPLSQWMPPTDRDANKVHTFAGVLPEASSVGHPGAGLWDTDPSAHPDGPSTFDPAMAAYYPQSRQRFGFYDSLGDLANKSTGNVSYLVVGWYWTDKHDPISVSAFPSKTLDKWKATVNIPAAALTDIVPQVTPTAATNVVTHLSATDVSHLAVKVDTPAIAHVLSPTLPTTVHLPSPTTTAPTAAGTTVGTPVSAQAPVLATLTPIWDVALKINPTQAPPPVKIATINREVARSGTVQLQTASLTKMVTNFPAANTSVAQWAQIGTAASRFVIARETVCHGAVVTVPLAGSGLAPVPIQNSNIHLYPNVQRALANLASNSGSADQINAVEMLLADLDAQKYSTGGILDMPGATHANTFQSVPGKAKVYARIDVEPAPQPAAPQAGFGLVASPMLSARKATGYWPEMQTRSASQVFTSRLSKFPNIKTVNTPAQPTAPTDAQQTQFVQNVQTAFTAAVGAAAAKGVTLDSQLIRVQDSRKNARSRALGPTTDGSGSDSAGWWINVSDTEAIKQLMLTTMGATVSLPSADNTYALPGPRWYRPWSPQIVLNDIGRTYKFGYGTRFRPDQTVLTRVSGTTLTHINTGKHPAIAGVDLLATPQSFNVAGLPSVVQSLAAETVLLDTESAGTMASLASPPTLVAVTNPAAAQAEYTAAIRGTWMSRDSSFSTAALNAVSYFGEHPSPLAVVPWQEPFDPLFLDTNYSHPHNGMSSWTLGTGDVDMTAVPMQGTPIAPLPVETFDERSKVTATLSGVLESALVTRVSVDPRGNTTKLQVVDKTLTPSTFQKMDVVSAPLTSFDSQLFARNYRLRAGSLRLNRMELVDMFGFTRAWTSGIAATSAAGDPSMPFWTPLPPRMPYWSRYNFRLTSAEDPAKEADSTTSPVCGLLLPDFLEHSLEVFDGEGNGLGQLITDPPIQGNTPATTLKVTYVPHPWLEPNADEFFHITNPILKSFVQSVAKQATPVPAGYTTWAESGLSAMMRVIDTIRGTFDPSSKTANRKVSLIGEPILVMSGRIQFNGSSAANANELPDDPAPLTTPPDMPTLSVRIGDASRPDDGVLGLFFSSPDDGHFAPVTKEAAEHALVNMLTLNNTQGTQAATHQFVQGQESLVSVPANQPVDVVILCDNAKAIYATCGALPRKKINVPKDFIDPAIKALEPSFYAGPVLASEGFDNETVLIPPPNVPGYAAEFLYEAAGDTSYSTSAVPAAPPLSELPTSRVTLTEGWLRMVPQKQP